MQCEKQENPPECRGGEVAGAAVGLRRQRRPSLLATTTRTTIKSQVLDQNQPPADRLIEILFYMITWWARHSFSSGNVEISLCLYHPKVKLRISIPTKNQRNLINENQRRLRFNHFEYGNFRAKSVGRTYKTFGW